MPITPDRDEAFIRYAIGRDLREVRKHDEIDRIERDYDVTGRVLDGTTQHLAVTSPADTTIVYGNRGGGKSISMLLHYARQLDAGYGHYYVGLILGIAWQSLDNIRSESEKLFGRLPGAYFFRAQQDSYWRFRAGEILMFRNCSEPEDYDNKVHGKSIAWLGIDEATVWQEPKVVDKALSTMRAGFNIKIHNKDPKNPIAPLKAKVFIATNSTGKGRIWFRERHIDGTKLGHIQEKVTKVASRRKGKLIKKPITQTKVVLFSSFVENPHYNDEMRARLYEYCDLHPAYYDLWIRGKWDVMIGGAFQYVWKKEVHVVPRFSVPDGWYIDRSMDWGTNQPTAIVWWAESDGVTPVLMGDETRLFPKGSLFAIGELYTRSAEDKNRGTGEDPTEIAQMVKDYENDLLSGGYIVDFPEPGPADRTIARVQNKQSTSVKDQMAIEHLYWTDSDSSPGARINGLALMLQRFKCALVRSDDLNDIRANKPGLYFCNNCVNIIRTVPVLNLDEKKLEDIATKPKQEDHLYDAIRYRVLCDKFVDFSAIMVNQ